MPDTAIDFDLYPEKTKQRLQHFSDHIHEVIETWEDQKGNGYIYFWYVNFQTTKPIDLVCFYNASQTVNSTGSLQQLSNHQRLSLKQICRETLENDKKIRTSPQPFKRGDILFDLIRPTTREMRFLIVTDTPTKKRIRATEIQSQTIKHINELGKLVDHIIPIVPDPIPSTDEGDVHFVSVTAKETTVKIKGDDREWATCALWSGFPETKEFINPLVFTQ